MKTYKLIDFMISGEIICNENYSMEYHREFFDHFKDMPLKFDGEIKSLLVFDLSQGTNTKYATIFFFGHTVDKLLSFPVGQMPKQIGSASLKVYKNQAEISNIFKF